MMKAVEITVTGPAIWATDSIQDLLDTKLVACAQVWPISSRFWWDGKIEQAEEMRVVMHSRASLFEPVRQRVAQSHPYETMCIVSTRLRDVDPDYLRWIFRSTVRS